MENNEKKVKIVGKLFKIGGVLFVTFPCQKRMKIHGKIQKKWVHITVTRCH